MGATADVSTIPTVRVVVPGEKDTIGVDFTNDLATGETIATATARLVRTLFRDAVAGVVTGATIDGVNTKQVNVAYDAAGVLPGVAYRLETTATLDTGMKKILVMDWVVA